MTLKAKSSKHLCENGLNVWTIYETRHCLLCVCFPLDALKHENICRSSRLELHLAAKADLWATCMNGLFDGPIRRRPRGPKPHCLFEIVTLLVGKPHGSMGSHCFFASDSLNSPYWATCNIYLLLLFRDCFLTPAAHLAQNIRFLHNDDIVYSTWSHRMTLEGIILIPFEQVYASCLTEQANRGQHITWSTEEFRVGTWFTTSTNRE